MRAKAAQTLQAFSRIVRAKGSVRRIQEANNANLRTRRMIFEMEQQESEGGVVVNHPPPPLAPTPRQNASPLESLAEFDHVDSRMSSNASKTHHPPRSNEISPTTAGAMAAAILAK
ncbi:Hypothetical protein, putative [Bodo saltans]|uniref:Uncharacterized protein n=1 Tax=Bodo saltans TaxID=75058 RepID=A0A0S4IMP2_BODSA|nr:Hypothetical protein, putative [Bodo saltans]|eukprot:CUF50363.1 Hypothetical protein, putative [Bodo saltans]